MYPQSDFNLDPSYGAYTAWSSAHILRIAGLVTIAVCSVALSNVTAVASFLPSIDVRRFVVS